MNEGAAFCVIARAAEDQRSALPEIVRALSSAFHADFSPCAAAIASQGTVVCQAGSFGRARQLAMQVAQAGVDALVANSQGVVVDVLKAPRTARPSRNSPALAATMLGGFGGAPGGAPVASAPHRGSSPSAPPKGRTTVGGMGAPPPLAIPGEANSAGPDSEEDEEQTEVSSVPGYITALTLPPMPAPKPQHFAASAPARPAVAGFGLAELDESKLMLLDGSSEEEPSVPPSQTHSSSVFNASFGPPAEEPALELGDEHVSYGLGTTSLESPSVDGDELNAEEPPAPTSRTESAPRPGTARRSADFHAVGQRGDSGADLDDTGDKNDDVEWIPAGDKDDEVPGPKIEIAGVPLGAIANRTPGKAGARSASAGHADSGAEHSPARRAAKGVRRAPQSPLSMLSEVFAGRPRLRIAAGFAVTLLMSSILPTCYAHGVVEKRILPVLVDLSTARVHGPLLAGTPGYRPPQVIEEQLSGTKFRYGFLTMLLWMSLFCGMGYGWHHITRER